MEKKQQAQVTRRNERNVIIPATDVWETPDEIILKMDMPGVDKDNLDIKVESDTLKIHGTIRDEQIGNVLYAEQRSGDFHREFSLSSDIDQNQIHATMNSGVLTVKIAKAEKVKPRKIQIAAQ
jgi:HSP20 family molecular chaperone IbpA